MSLGDITKLSSSPLYLNPTSTYMNNSLIHSDGSVKYALHLTLARFESPLERFSLKSKGKMPKNLTALLTDVSSQDLKIMTSDGATLSAHKLIIKGKFI